VFILIKFVSERESFVSLQVDGNIVFVKIDIGNAVVAVRLEILLNHFRFLGFK
jgi:hypothetical protein